MFKISQIPHLLLSLSETLSNQMSDLPKYSVESILSSNFRLTKALEKTKYNQLINDLHDFPESLGLCLSMVKFQYLNDLLSQRFLSYEDAIEAVDIVEILNSRNEFDITEISIQLDSKIGDSISICIEIEELPDWAVLSMNFLEKFSVKSEISTISLNLTLHKLVFNYIYVEGANIILVLNVLRFFQNKTKIDVSTITNLAIERCIKIIQDLENIEEYWEISLILAALYMVEPKIHINLLENYKKKYQTLNNFELKPIGNKIFNEIKVKSLADIKLGHYKIYEDISDGQKIRIYKGTLNKINPISVEVIRVKNENRIRLCLEELEKNKEVLNNLPFLRYFGYIEQFDKNGEFLYIVYETLAQDLSLNQLVKNNTEIDIIHLAKDLASLLLELEKNKVSVYFLNPKKIYIDAGNVMLPFSILLNTYPYSKYSQNFQSIEFTNFINKSCKTIDIYSNLVYSYSLTIFYSIFKEFFDKNSKLEDYINRLNYMDKKFSLFKQLAKKSDKPSTFQDIIALFL